MIDMPELTVTTNREELMELLEQMTTMRRMEVAFDLDYKKRLIRGFCHLYDGQEAVASGLEAALKPGDDIVTSYRCHAIQYSRGCPIEAIAAELFGNAGGVSKGKGGSMHMYWKENNFWGGNGIVGAQVPLGAGAAFAHKYSQKGDEEMNVALAMYGDGAANQGQCWEAANMAALWGLPLILICENNKYGMGTAISRSSALTDYYKQGKDVIPGIRVDGMDVLAVRAATQLARDWASSGKGPIYMEMDTYRYHGHSMSDPGISYRSRDEVTATRKARDPLTNVKNRLIELGLAEEKELKEMEKRVRKEVDAAVAAAKEHSLPDASQLYTDIYAEPTPARGTEIDNGTYVLP
eukprot:PLAT4229.1.p1 GENE.PLAT4229.1~~PLAT4229.1.p1  ORF type:complete len:401 (+),score=187.25 PLAT4229.1:153-1205(+)